MSWDPKCNSPTFTHLTRLSRMQPVQSTLVIIGYAMSVLYRPHVMAPHLSTYPKLAFLSQVQLGS
jgi:hypothetical protein